MLSHRASASASHCRTANVMCAYKQRRARACALVLKTQNSGPVGACACTSTSAGMAFCSRLCASWAANSASSCSFSVCGGQGHRRMPQHSTAQERARSRSSAPRTVRVRWRCSPPKAAREHSDAPPRKCAGAQVRGARGSSSRGTARPVEARDARDLLRAAALQHQPLLLGPRALLAQPLRLSLQLAVHLKRAKGPHTPHVRTAHDRDYDWRARASRITLAEPWHGRGHTTTSSYTTFA